MIAIALAAFLAGAVEARCPTDAGVAPWLVCLDVAAAARSEGVPVRLAVTLAWSESRFDAAARSTTGALGPLQIQPAYWCPGGRREGCDLARAGARALATLTRRYGAETGLCHYASGNVCTASARRYARFILRAAGRP